MSSCGVKACAHIIKHYIDSIIHFDLGNISQPIKQTNTSTSPPLTSQQQNTSITSGNSVFNFVFQFCLFFNLLVCVKNIYKQHLI